MRLRRVVHERAAEYVGRFGEMKYLLAPFVASRPEEQRNFYAFWDRFVADMEEKWAEDNQGGLEGSSPRSARWWWLLLPLMALLGYGVYAYFNPGVPVPEGEHYAVKIGLPDTLPEADYAEYTRLKEGDTLRLLNLTQGKLRSEDSTGFRWRVEDTRTSLETYGSSGFHLEMARPLVQGEGLRVILTASHLGLAAQNQSDTLLFSVSCTDPPRAPVIVVPEGPVIVDTKYNFSIAEPEEGVVYDWNISNEGSQGVRTSGTFVLDGQQTVTVRAVRGLLANIDVCYTEVSVEVMVLTKDHDLPILASIPLERDQPRTIAARSTAFKWGASPISSGFGKKRRPGYLTGRPPSKRR